MEKKKVLFICSYNSVRSQMAEGLLKYLYPESYEVYSAGLEESGVNPHARKVLKETGIDISNQHSKNITEFLNKKFDYVVAMSNEVKQTYPAFPGAKRYIHKNFLDPAATRGNEESILNTFRKVKDEIKNWIEKTFQSPL